MGGGEGRTRSVSTAWGVVTGRSKRKVELSLQQIPSMSCQCVAHTLDINIGLYVGMHTWFGCTGSARPQIACGYEVNTKLYAEVCHSVCLCFHHDLTSVFPVQRLGMVIYSGE